MGFSCFFLYGLHDPQKNTVISPWKDFERTFQATPWYLSRPFPIFRPSPPEEVLVEKPRAASESLDFSQRAAAALLGAVFDSKKSACIAKM